MLPALSTTRKRVGKGTRGNSPGGRSPRNGFGRLPDPEGGDFAPFLKIEDAPGERFVIEFTGGVEVGQNSKFGQQVIAPVKIGKKEYNWGIRTKSRNYRLLLERFGKKESNWKGKVKVEVQEFNGNEFIAVCE